MDSSAESSALFATLARNLDGDIDTSPKARSLGSVDASFVSIPPQAIAYPKTIEDFEKLFLFAKEYRLPLSVRGRGTSTSGGSLTEGIQIDMTRYFSKVERVNIKNNTATIAAGTRIADVVERLEKVGVFCPLLSSDAYDGTIGGLVALNGMTAASITHGSTRLWVEGLRVVLDDGKEYSIEEGSSLLGRLAEIYMNLASYIERELGNIRISVNRNIDSSSGYNLWGHSIGQRQLLDVLIGGEGTLGIITAVTLRVIPLIKEKQVVLCKAHTLNELRRAEKIYQSSGADSLSLFDTDILELLPPEYVRNLSPFMRKTDARYMLFGLFRRKTADLAKQAAHACGAKLSQISKELLIEDGALWRDKERLLHFNAWRLSRAHSAKASIITTLDGIAVEDGQQENLFEELASLIVSSGYMYLLGSIASPTNLSFYFFADTSTRDERDALDACLARAGDTVRAHKGSLTSGNGDGLVRTPYMETSSDRHMLNAFSYIQRLFDPEQVFNCGKKTFYTLAAINHYLHSKAVA